VVKSNEEVGPMQKLSERLNTFADAATLLTIIAFIAFAAWLLAHSG
jgi:flagellar biogenesis protein FliO